MKNILCTIITLFILLGCMPTTTNTSKTTPSTESLISFFKKYKSLEYNSGNDILKQEMYNKREKDLMDYIDSIAILTNIEGKISDIKLEEGGSTDGYKILRYNIKISPEKYFEITFKCVNSINNDSLDTDYIYNRIKQFSNYSTVYFDGIISVNAEKNLPRSIDYGLNLAFSYPKYRFHIIDIATSQLNDTIDSSLKASLQTGRKAINYLFQKYRSEKCSETELRMLSGEFMKTKAELTDSQQKYVQRYMNSIILDIIK